MRQIEWSAPRNGVIYGMNGRFVITKSTTHYTVGDRKTGELARTHTLAAARAWAGVRVGGEDVRHGGFHDE